MGRQVYENLKVLDVTNNYAGPMAGAMLAGWAACDEPLIQETLKHLVSDKHPELFDRNLQALRLGSRFRGFPPQAG